MCVCVCVCVCVGRVGNSETGREESQGKGAC